MKDKNASGRKSPVDFLRTAVECLFLPAAIFILTYDPNHGDGRILPLEAGMHLGAINDLLYGRIPFRDTISLYGPLSELIPFVVMKLFGITLLTLRSYYHCTTILGIIIAYFLAREVLRTRVFTLIAALILIIETFDPFWSTRWGGIRSGTGLLVLFLLIKSYDSPQWKRCLYWAGLAGIFALLNSTEIGVLAVITAMVYALLRSWMEGGSLRQSFPYLKPFFTGFGTLLVPFLLYYTITGSLAAYVQFTFLEFPFNHISRFAQGNVPPLIPEGLGLRNVLPWIMSYEFMIYLPALIYILTGLYLAFILVSRKVSAKRETIVLVILLIYGIPLYAAAFRAIRGPQFTASITPSLLSACVLLEGFYFARKRSPERPGRLRLARTLIFFLVLLTFLSYVAFSRNSTYGSGKEWIRYEIGKFKNYGAKEPGLVPLGLERGGNVYLPPEQVFVVTGVVRYIQTHTAPREAIFAFPVIGSYYFLADRYNFTKFPAAEVACINERYRAELIEDVRRRAPRYVIFDTKISGLARSIGTTDEKLMPEIFRFCADHYAVEASFGQTLIMRRHR